MTSLFDDINQFDEGFLAARREAVAVAQKRVQDRVGSYLKVAKTAEEYDARLNYVSDDVRQIVADVAEEFSIDHDKLADAIDEHLKGDGITDIDAELADAPSAVGQKSASDDEPTSEEEEEIYEDENDKRLDDDKRTSGGHKPGCTCGFCKNKGNLPGQVDQKEQEDKDASEPHDEDDDDSGEEKESSVHVADAPRDGGGATKTVDLPHAKGDAVGYGASPKIDKKEWKPNALNDSGNLKPVDAEMSGTPVPTKTQDLVDEKPDYDGDFLRDTDAVTTQQDLPSADDTGQSTERNLSQEGQGGTWTEEQTSPVTSEVFASVDPDINPLKAILDSGFTPDNQVESAIREFESE